MISLRKSVNSDVIKAPKAKAIINTAIILGTKVIVVS